MACADRRTANSAVITWTPDGGSAVQLEGDFTTFSFDDTIDTEDATAGNETDRCFVPTIRSVEGSITIYDAKQTYKGDIQPGQKGVLNMKPDGTGSGLEEVECTAYMTGYSEEFPFDGLLEIELSWTRSGAWAKAPGSLQA